MKRILSSKIVLMFCSVFFCTFFISVCNAEEYEDIDSDEVTIKATDIEIEGYEKELMIGDTMSLTATVVPSNATDTVVTFKSSDNSVATVKSSGTVKGEKAGNVTIYVTCGDITKELPITVKVKTDAIKVNSQYVVMRQGEEFKIQANVVPDTADNNLTYKSLDEHIAVVSDKGIIDAKECGTSSILVSNGYSQVSITVVVNKTASDTNQNDKTVSDVTEIEDYPEVIDSDVCKTVTSDMLKYYYNNNVDFDVRAEKYSIHIDASDIVNCNNELNTVIDFQCTPDSVVFETDNKLCGKLTLDMSEIIDNHKYLYLYNNDKKKYERIEVEDINNITIDTAGKYLISTDILSDESFNIWFIIGGIIALIIGVAVYIVLKKKYWFW